MPGADYSSDESEDEEEDDEWTDWASDSDDSIATVTQRNSGSSRMQEIARRPNRVRGPNLPPSARKPYIDVTAFQRIYTVPEVIQPQSHTKGHKAFRRTFTVPEVIQPHYHPRDYVRALP
jgi:hypothetical protein